MDKPVVGGRVLQILILEDNAVDVELCVRRLKNAGLEFVETVCRNAREFRQIWEKQAFDLVLGDYRLPDWNGLDAIRWLRSSGILTPFILVTGTLGDELAIECIKAGADDYVLKEKLDRLPIAVQRALAEQRLRQERDWAERELRESENQYRLLFHSNPCPMWVFDVESSKFLAVNDAAVRHYGYSTREFLAMSVKDILVSTESSRYQRRGAPTDAANTSYQNEPSRHRKKDGTVIDVQVSSEPILFRGVKARLALNVDVTERIRLEQQLRYSQKMEAIGRLAGGVAHDFNNLLMVISSHTQLIRDHLDSHDRVDRYIGHITNAIERATLLTQQLLAFGRKQIQDLRVLDMRTLVADFCKMLPGLLGSRVQLTFRASAEPSPVFSDKSQLEQVIMNLVVNARDAMPGGGKVSIEIENVTLGRQYFQIHNVEAEPGRYVVLAVNDTGVGMEPATQAQIFEPFFTTKEPGKGTGLGLSTVYGIVKQSGGYIWAYSEPGRGTTFKIYLPYAEEIVEQVPIFQPSDESKFQGGETILLVEDEAGLRVATAEFLESKGYEVLAAGSAPEALNLLSDHPDVNLLLTDLVMPGVGGMELATKVREQNRGLKVIYMSGYSQRMADTSASKQAIFIQKPFGFGDLMTTVRRALDEAEQQSSELQQSPK